MNSKLPEYQFRFLCRQFGGLAAGGETRAPAFPDLQILEGCLQFGNSLKDRSLRSLPFQGEGNTAFTRSSDKGKGNASTFSGLPFRDREGRILQALGDPAQEAGCTGSVDEPVIVRQRQR